MRPPQIHWTVLRPIALIRDWSSSMNERLSGREITRAQAALNTLRKRINNTILVDSRVSFTVYGHRISFTARTWSSPGPRTSGNEFNSVYEEVFQKKIDRSKNALQDIETEFPMSRFDVDARDQLHGVLTRINSVPPFGLTPLAGAITRGFTTELQGGTGIVISVTDGKAKDVGPSADPGVRARNQQQEELLREALRQSPGSRAVIVAFDVKQNVE